MSVEPVVEKKKAGRPKKEIKTKLSLKISQELLFALRNFLEDKHLTLSFFSEKTLQEFLDNPPKDMSGKFSKENKVVFSTSITPRLQAELRDYVDKNGRTLSFVIEYVFRVALGLPLVSI